MGLRFIQYLWFTLLAMVLPTQALACPNISENETTTRQLVAKNAATPLSTISAIVDEQAAALPEPYTTARQQGKSFASAILSQSRWDRAPRMRLDDGHANASPLAAARVIDVPSATEPLAILSSWFYQNGARSFRLAGWKETNALYVALNSQFPLLHFV